MTGTSHWSDGRLIPLLVFPAVSAVMLAAAFPPLPLGFLAYFGLIPLLLASEKLSGMAAFGAGYVHGLIFYGLTIYWVAAITPPGTVGAVLYLALFKGLFVWVLGIVRQRLGPLGLWVAPFLWTAVEYVNSLGDMGFPWCVLGITQSTYLLLIQYADVTGVFGVSFWIVLVNAVVLAVVGVRLRRASAAVAVAVLFVVPAVQGFWTLGRAPRDEGTLPVGIVQPNVIPVAKESRGFGYNFEILKELTLQAVERGARLVIWPETAVPAYLQSEVHRPHRERLQAFADSLDIHLFTGAWHFEDGSPPRSYNSSFLFVPGKTEIRRYDKIKLVPFGERAPFPGLLPFLRRIRFTGGGFVAADFEAGEELAVLDGPGALFSALICFDSVFPDFVRQFVARGAEFIVIITNDGWFGKTSGPFQHAEAAVFRAIENRRDVARAANTGVSTLIDAYGRKDQTTGIYHEAVLSGRLTPRQGLTFYTRYGDLFSQACLALAVLAAVMAFAGTPAEGGRREAQTEAPLPDAGTVQVNPEGGETDARQNGSESVAMPFLDHLEELRWRILKGLAAIGAGAIVCGLFSNEILNALTWPVRRMEAPPQLIFLKPMGMFLVKLSITLVGGAILALPVLLYQLWLFVAPGLYLTERRYVTFIIFSSTVCFVVGGSVAYWGVVPLALKFLVGMQSGTDVLPQFDIGMYISFVLRLLVAFGVVFELPVATFFLAKVGVLTQARMRAGRRYAILMVFILGALLTPPDPITQMMMAIPLVLLYEVSIWVAKVAGR